jgi:hypothetical protein
MAEKEVLLSEQQEHLESMGSAQMVADSLGGRKGSGSCGRCGRKLTNPHSIARNLGPVCYRKSGGGAFDGELQADEEEWQRREQLLQRGGEHDFGWWDYVEQTPDGPVPVTRGLRISIRCEMGRYIVYGAFHKFGLVTGEIVFYNGTDLRAAWRAAIAAGPECNAAAYRVRRDIARAWRAQARGGGRRVR